MARLSAGLVETNTLKDPMLPKASFETIDFNLDVVMDLSTGPYDFCELWQKYLSSCGWTEFEYEKEVERRIFGNQN